MPGSSPMPCPSCGSELSIFPRNPVTGSPCHYCGYNGMTRMPAPIREWLGVHLAGLDDRRKAYVVIAEFITWLAEQKFDRSTQFSAKLVLEEAIVTAMKRRRD